MAEHAHGLHVVSYDRYPRAFWWHGRQHRVLALEGVRVVGGEHRYRLATAEGPFELAQSPTGAWQVRRSPGLLGRIQARWENAPRYPLPTWRRRAYRPALVLDELSFFALAPRDLPRSRR